MRSTFVWRRCVCVYIYIYILIYIEACVKTSHILFFSFFRRQKNTVFNLHHDSIYIIIFQLWFGYSEFKFDNIYELLTRWVEIISEIQICKNLILKKKVICEVLIESRYIHVCVYTCFSRFPKKFEMFDLEF